MSIWPVEPNRLPELMDDPALPPGEHVAALDALATLNAVSLTTRHLAAGVRRVAAQAAVAGRPLRVVDVACGGGDITVALAARLGDRGVFPGGVELLGIDMSERAIARGREQAARKRCRHVDFTVRNVLAEGCPPCDVVVSSLFLHHLDDADALVVLRSMAAAAALGGVVSDLIRSRTGLVMAIVGTQLLARSRVARVDGPRSVRAARTPAEYRALADRAGLPQATVRRTWPERVLLEWKTAEAIDQLVTGMACA